MPDRTSIERHNGKLQSDFYCPKKDEQRISPDPKWALSLCKGLICPKRAAGGMCPLSPAWRLNIKSSLMPLLCDLFLCARQQKYVLHHWVSEGMVGIAAANRKISTSSWCGKQMYVGDGYSVWAGLACGVKAWSDTLSATDTCKCWMRGFNSTSPLNAVDSLSHILMWKRGCFQNWILVPVWGVLKIIGKGKHRCYYW